MGTEKIKGTRVVRGESEDVEVTVTTKKKFGFTKIDKKLIVQTVLEGKGSLHKTKKATGCPADATGYIHNKSENTLWAVKSVDSDKLTIEIIAEGQAKAKVHQFK